VKAELPSTLDSSHQREIDKSKSLKGADSSSRYDSDQQSGHKDAVSLFERYAKGGDNSKLKDWADKTLPTLRHHLDMANDLTAGKAVGSHWLRRRRRRVARPYDQFNPRNRIVGGVQRWSEESRNRGFPCKISVSREFAKRRVRSAVTQLKLVG
jgi:hypothetical protein